MLRVCITLTLGVLLEEALTVLVTKAVLVLLLCSGSEEHGVSAKAEARREVTGLGVGTRCACA
jgi:hypothetical protein